MDPLWAHAPLAAFRRPGFLAAVALGAALLAVAAASAPLYVSAASSEALERELERVTTFGAGASLLQSGISNQPPGPEGLEERIRRTDRELGAALAGVPHLGSPFVTVVGPVVKPSPTAAPADERPLRLLARDDALANVERVSGTDGDGLWLADEAARFIGVEPGDTLYLHYDPGRPPVAVTIDGLYRELWREPPRPYWRSLRGLIYERNPDAGPPPTFLIGDSDQVIELSRRLGVEFLDVRRDWPLETTSLTLGEAEETAAGLAAFQRGTQEADSRVGRALRCATCPSGFGRERIEYASQLGSGIAAASETIATLRSPIDLLAAAGVLVALAVLASSAAFALGARRVETGFLVAHGYGSASVGARTVLEALLPAAVGAAVGLGAAAAAVGALGPGTVEPQALGEAARATAIALPVALGLVGLVAVLVFRAALPHRALRRHATLRRIPWEVLLLAAAAYALWRLRRDGAFLETEGAASRASWTVLVFPVLLLGGGSLLAARLLVRGLSRRNRGRALRPGAAHLARRRLAAAGPLAAGLTAACALAVGTLIYAQALVRSLEATAAARAYLFVGSDVQGFTSPTRVVPADLGVPATLVTRLTDVASLGGTAVDVLVVDAPTVAPVVYWDSSWSDRPLERLLGELRAEGRRLPVVVAGPEPPGRELSVLGLVTPVDVVGHADAFPGMAQDRALVVVDREALAAAAERAGVPDPRLAGGIETLVWARGDPDRALRVLEASPLRPYPVLTAEEVRRNPTIRSVTQTFAFLSALGLATGLLAVAATLLYAQARQRARSLGQALTSRMGLSDAAHRLANALELGALLVSGALVGAALALGAARLVLPELDAPVRLPSGPLFRAPWSFVLAAVLGLTVVALVAAAVVAARGRRVNVAEVLRAGE